MAKGSRYDVVPLIEFWRIGRDSRKELSHGQSGRPGDAETRFVHGFKQAVKEKIGAKYGLNSDMLGKAWRVAEQYTDAQIRHWDDLIREHGAGFGSCHLKDLLVIPDRKKRDRMMKEAIRNDWSVKQLAMKIQATFGKRPRAGRKPQVPQDTAELVTKLRMHCEKWVNFCRSAEAQFAGKLAAALKIALVEVGRVQELADKSLKRARPDPNG